MVAERLWRLPHANGAFRDSICAIFNFTRSGPHCDWGFPDSGRPIDFLHESSVGLHAVEEDQLFAVLNLAVELWCQALVPDSPRDCQLDQLAKSASLPFASHMKRFWQITALVLLALMVPASMCCLVPLESAALACAGCCHDDDHGAQDVPDICPSDTIAHSQLPSLAAVPTAALIELAEIIDTVMRLDEPVLATAVAVPLMTTAPPELSVTWAFASRAAQPVRAPSALG